MNKFAVVFFALCLVSARAEERVRFPEGNQTWTIEILPSEQSSGDALAVVRVERAVYDGVERWRVFRSDKSVSEVWKSEGIVLAKDPATGRVGMSSPAVIPSLAAAPDAALFSWVASAPPGREDTFKKRKALRYDVPAATGSPEMFANAEEWRPRRAWIDQDTLLPIAYDNGAATVIFSFGPPPDGPLAMPADFAKLCARILSSKSQQPSWAKKK